MRISSPKYSVGLQKTRVLSIKKFKLILVLIMGLFGGDEIMTLKMSVFEKKNSKSFRVERYLKNRNYQERKNEISSKN